MITKSADIKKELKRKQFDTLLSEQKNDAEKFGKLLAKPKKKRRTKVG